MKDQLRLPGQPGRPRKWTDAEHREIRRKREAGRRKLRKTRARALERLYRFSEALAIDMEPGQTKNNLLAILEAVRKTKGVELDTTKTKGGKT